MTTADTTTDAAAWHVRLYKKSLTKQAKLKNLQLALGSTEGKVCLDIGGDNGVIPYLLRQQGGTWVSVDSSPKAVASMREMFGTSAVHLIDGIELPFEDQAFDVIVIIDYLEHLRDDAGFIRECHRCIRQGGHLIINVPHLKRLSLIRGIRKLLGLTDAQHGHVRPGYRLQDLYEISKDGFDLVQHHTYGGFFVELVDTFIQFAGSFQVKSGAADQKGLMVDAADLDRCRKAFKIYSFLFPFLKLAQGLDAVFRFSRNHYLVANARARMWIPRRGVKIRDGRSIAEASINTTIGTAAELNQRR